MNPGKLYRVDEEKYRAFHAANYSTLKQGRECAAAMKWAIDNPTETSEAMLLGRACEALVFGEPIAVAPACDRRTKAGKEEWAAFVAAHAGGLVVSAEVSDTAKRMADSVNANPDAVRLLAGHRQVCAVWESSGVLCKGRIDAFQQFEDGSVCLTDLKTTRSSLDDRAIGSEFAARGYHIQAAFYADGFAACTGGQPMFSFVVVQNRPPYGCIVRRLDDESIDAGRKWYRHLLTLWDAGNKSGVWPGVDGKIGTLEVPKYERDAADRLGWSEAAASDDHPF